MSNDADKKDIPTTAVVTVNWEGLARLLGWQGSIADLKQVELDGPPVQRKRSR
jgi:hypothetical protein